MFALINCLQLGVLEFHLDVLPVGRINLPQGSLGKVEELGDDYIWELFNPNIIDIDRLVEKFTPVRDLIFKFGDPVPELLKRLVRLEVRISFYHHE